jgi:ABC-type transport system substrate-binding protein
MKSFLLFVTAFTFLLTSCSKKESSQYENYVHEAIITNVKGFDPTFSGELYAGIVMGEIYEGLLQYNYLERPTHVEPLLADGMPKVSKDGLTYTFKIKTGVKFHDSPAFKATDGKGRELIASDFIYSWKRLADPKNKSDMFWIFDGKVKGMTEWRDAAAKAGAADYSKPVEGLSAPDDHTLVISLIKPYPQMLYVLTLVGAMVVPHEVVDFYGPEFLNNPVGTGPYRFKNWIHNAQIILEKNPNYHEEFYPSKGEETDKAAGLLDDAGKRLPLNDGIVFTEAVEDQPRWLNFRKGVYDWIKIPKDNFTTVIKNGELIDELKNQGMTFSHAIDPEITYQGFNMEDPVLGKNKYLRQAMSVAADVREVIAKFDNGMAVPAEGPIPPTILGYDPKKVSPYYHFDLEKAKSLMKKAGYPNGEGLPEFTYEMYTGSGLRQQAELFQEQMAKIGVKIRINVSTWPEFRDKLKSRKAQIFGLAWLADYPDAENFLQLFYSKNSSPGPNDANYVNPEYDKLYEKISVMLDSPERNRLYQKMVDIVVEDCPYIFERIRTPPILTQGWLKNYKRNLMILNYIKYYRIDQEAKAKLKAKL